MSVFSDNIGIIITSTLGGIGTFIGFLRGKNLKKSEEKTKESTANIEIGKAYQLMAEQNKLSLEDFRRDMQQVKDENIEQRKDLRTLQTDNRKLHLEMSKLHVQNNELKQLVSELQIENKLLTEELKKYRKK